MQTIGSDLDEGLQQYPPARFQRGDPVWCQFTWPTFNGRCFPGMVESWQVHYGAQWVGVVRTLIDGYWYRLPVMLGVVRARVPDAVPLRDDFGHDAFWEPKRRQVRSHAVLR